jgi:hydroxymethylpyrimidine pyrophosphatase-like HAD family hydrolase
MGNASGEVKGAAHHVTTSNAEEGFANAVDRFILGEQSAPGLSASARSSR